MTAWEDARTPDTARVTPAFPGPRLETIWSREPGLKGWLGDVDHKEIGKRYIVTALLFLALGGMEGPGPAPAADRAGAALPYSIAVRPAVHPTWGDHDLPLRLPDPVGVFQLPLAPAAGVARHGLPAAERALLLDLLGGGDLPLFRLRGRGGAGRGLVQLCPLCGEGLQSRRQYRHLRPGPDPAGDLDLGGIGELRRHLPPNPGAGHVDQPRADPDLGHAHRLGRQPAGGAERVSLCVLPAVDGPRSSARTSSARARDSRCCGSICSGCSAIPGSTPSCCRPWAWCPTPCRPSAAGPLVGYTPVALSTVGPWRWASASGSTTCSPPACPDLALSFFSGASADHHHAQRRGRVRLDGDDLPGAAGDHGRPSCSSRA